MAGTEERTPRHRSRRAEYIATIIVNGILIFVFNNLLNWNTPFLTQSFRDVLWAFNLSLGATIAVNAIFIYYDPGWFRHLGHVFLNILGFIAVYQLFTVFPFSFSDPLRLIVKIALIAAMVGTGIAVLVEFVQLVLHKD